MEKYLLIFLIALVGLLIILVVFLLAKGNKSEETFALKRKIEDLEKNISHDMSEKLNEKFNVMSRNITADLNQQADRDEKRLIEFQSSMNKSLNDNIASINKRIDDNLKGINEKVDKSLNDGFKSTLDTVERLKKDLGALEEAQKGLQSINNNVMELSNILNNNQSRGKYGEWSLELMLRNSFGDTRGNTYDFQYQMKDGSRVDAAVFLDGRDNSIVPIDSKFSIVGYETLLENKGSEEELDKARKSFIQALKKRIDETSKYINSPYTLPNALMYIPADSIFAYISANLGEVGEYANKNNVILVSPTILIPLIAAFKVIQIDKKKNKNIAKVNNALNQLGEEFRRFGSRWTDLSKHIANLADDKGQLDTTVGKIQKKFSSIQHIELDDELNESSELE